MFVMFDEFILLLLPVILQRHSCKIIHSYLVSSVCPLLCMHTFSSIPYAPKFHFIPDEWFVVFHIAKYYINNQNLLATCTIVQVFMIVRLRITRLRLHSSHDTFSGCIVSYSKDPNVNDRKIVAIPIYFRWCNFVCLISSNRRFPIDLIELCKAIINIYDYVQYY